MGIGIDTHSLDTPKEADELSPEQEDRLSEIEQAIADLVGEYEKITTDKVYIAGYVDAQKVVNQERSLRAEIERLNKHIIWMQELVPSEQLLPPANLLDAENCERCRVNMWIAYNPNTGVYLAESVVDHLYYLHISANSVRKIRATSAASAWRQAIAILREGAQ